MQTATATQRCGTPAQPNLLADHVLRAEQRRHERRLASIERMRAGLRMLGAYLPAIVDAGIKLRGEEFHGLGAGVVYIGASDAQRNAALEQVLRAQGMRETKRTEHSDGSYLLKLQKGRLTVSLTVAAQRLAAPGAAP